MSMNTQTTPSSGSRISQGYFQTPPRGPVGYDSSHSSFSVSHSGVQREYCPQTSGITNSSLWLDTILPPTQPRTQTLRTPPDIQSSSYDVADFRAIDTDIGHNIPMINSTFIDAVAQSMGLQATDEDYRNSLHSIPMVYHART